MKQARIILVVLVCTSLTAVGQNIKSYEIDLSNPKNVVNAIFYAAQKKDFSVLEGLCDPYGEEDGDTKAICAISQTAKQLKESGGVEGTQKVIDGFVKLFKTGRITGKVTYEEHDGTGYATVPFFFNHPAGESRSNETMKLVKRDGNWYLSSF